MRTGSPIPGPVIGGPRHAVLNNAAIPAFRTQVRLACGSADCALARGPIPKTKRSGLPFEERGRMIEVQHLTKRYEGTTALDDVSFTVEDGTVCGLLGPNGAGKSTTMNIMCGCLAATSGEVRFDGLEIFSDAKAVKASIGYLPEQPPLYQEMTPWEYLLFVGRAKGLSRTESEDAAIACGVTCGLENVSDRLIRNLSKGYKQRVGIAQALMGNPKTIVLDEPTVGLDPIQLIEIRELIKKLGRQHTVIVSSHILSEIRALCDRVVIISHGKMVANGAPDTLEQQLAGTRTTTLIARAKEARLRSALSQVKNVSGVEFEKGEDDQVTATVHAKGSTDIREAIYRACVRENIALLEMSTTRASLEDVFVELAGDGRKG